MSTPNTTPAAPDALTEEVLLAFIQGRLAPAAAAEIDRRAADDPRLAADIALMRSLAAAAPDTAAAPGLELGWARLSRAVDAQGRGGPLSRPRFSAWHMAAAAAAAAGLTILLGDLGAPAPPAYQTAAGPQAGGYAAQVAFAPTVPEARLREALLGARAEIIAGPSALGVYRLGFADAAARDAGIAALKAQPDLVETIAVD